MQDSKPNFLLIGAARSGTTAIARFLEQHPEVFVCDPKEPHFLALGKSDIEFKGPGDELMMNRVLVRDAEEYGKLFQPERDCKAIGEGSVSTLYYHEQSIPAIKEHAPTAKMIAVLRNPIERAYSSFMYTTSRGFEPLEDFEQALDEEANRIEQAWHHIWHYTQMGFYTSQLEKFFEQFDRQQMKIVLFDDFQTKPAEVLADLFQFLEVDPTFRPDVNAEVNRSGVPRNRLIGGAINFVYRQWYLKNLLKAIIPPGMRDSIRNASLARPAMSSAAFARLADHYREEVLTLSELLDCDLSGWLTNQPVASRYPTGSVRS